MRSQTLKWGKRDHLAETAGVWESAAIRQTSLAPADYLKARPPPGRLRPPLPPTISFPKSVARIIKLVEERREGDGGRGQEKEKTSSLATQPCQASDPSSLIPQPTCSLPRSIVASLGLPPICPLCSYSSSPLLPVFSFPRVALFPLSLPLFCFNWEVFAKELIGSERVSSFDREFTSGTDSKICSPLARRRPEVVQLESCTV